ncbi:MAG: NADH-quinone oxidoreductase subunit C [Clostridia bacterium]|nr:NADH-quinone oxidoreductase subunit C [Clostridia bacterium]
MDKQIPLDEVIAGLQDKYPEQLAVVEGSLQPAVRVKTEVFLKVMQDLKNEYGLDFLADLTAVDLGDEGFRGITHVMSWRPYRMLRVEVDTPRNQPRIPSLVDLWPAADVQEREAYDMFGIVYDGHPKLTRILLSDNFEGYPLRKDFQVASKR